jgi:hypothetical protein
MYRHPATGAVMERLNDQGRADYKVRQAEALAAYGPYPGMDDPNHPAPVVIPGGPNYNPFAPKGGEWS